MIPYEQAVEIVRNNAVRLGIESVSLQASLNRVLRQEVASDVDMPPFDKSAMDGYACRRLDLANPLDVVEVIPAGVQPERSIGENECSKIMTGAVVPDGADCVIIVEEVEELSSGKIRFKAKNTADNICRKGEDVVAGQVLVPSGSRVTAKEIAAHGTRRFGCAGSEPQAQKSASSPPGTKSSSRAECPRDPRSGIPIRISFLPNASSLAANRLTTGLRPIASRQSDRPFRGQKGRTTSYF